MNLSNGDFGAILPPVLSAILTLIPYVLKIDVESCVVQLKRLAPPNGNVKKAQQDDEPMMMDENEMNGKCNGADAEEGSRGGGEEAGSNEELAEDSEEWNEGDTVDILPKKHRSKTVERLSDLLTAQQMALEMLTNICSAAGRRAFKCICMCVSVYWNPTVVDYVVFFFFVSCRALV